MKDVEAVEVLFDRFTFIAHYNGDRFEKYLKESVYIRYNGFSKTPDFEYAYKGMNGEFIEVGKKDRKVRIEFNPNKADLREIKTMFSKLEYPRLRRIDIAIDFFGVDLSKIHWKSGTDRESQFILGKSGKLETIYLGCRRSEKYFRIYNKKREREAKEKAVDIRAKNGHWRVELEYKPDKKKNNIKASDYFPEGLFDIKAQKKKGLDFSGIEKIQERAMINWLIEHPEEKEELGNSTKAKFNKLIEQVREKSGRALSIEPCEVYEKEKSHLTSQLDDYLAQFHIGKADLISMK